MKIILVCPSFELAGGERSISYPVGLATLGAVLEKEGHSVDVLDLSDIAWEEAKVTVKETIEKQKPDIVGISNMCTNRVSSFELIKLTKEINPNIKILMGGAHPTLMYKQLLDNFPIDYIIVGEGEKTTPELIRNIENKSPFFRGIKGIAFKSDREIIFTGNRDKMNSEELDKLPFPNHSYFKSKINKYGVAYIASSRGCPFNCIFCSSSQYWGRCRTQRSASNILSEIKHLKQQFPELKSLYFVDDEFICDKKRIMGLCDMMIKEKINLTWECLGRATSISEELVKHMKQAGCTKIKIGIETGSEKLLKSINKGVTTQQIIKASKIIQKCGVIVSAFLIVGFPGEDKDTVKETIALLKEIKIVGEPAILQIYPGTELYDYCKEKGYLTDEFWLEDKLVPLFIYEHSRAKLMFWITKISFFSTLYTKGYLCAFKLVLGKIFKRIRLKSISQTIRRYVVDEK